MNYSDIVRNIDKAPDDEFDSSDEEYYERKFLILLYNVCYIHD